MQRRYIGESTSVAFFNFTIHRRTGKGNFSHGFEVSSKRCIGGMFNESGDFVEDVLRLYREKNWKEIIDRFHRHPEKSKLLWVFPSEDNLKFIERILDDNDISEIISVGCGSGLFEWILKAALGVAVKCIEVDGAWWQCKYAPPTFSPLHIAQPTLDEDNVTKSIVSNERAAIMFCYFNNRTAFVDYLKHFTGDTLIVIGPGEGKCVHTDPLPLDAKLDESKWRLMEHQEVRDSKDFIALYKRVSEVH